MTFGELGTFSSSSPVQVSHAALTSKSRTLCQRVLCISQNTSQRLWQAFDDLDPSSLRREFIPCLSAAQEVARSLHFVTLKHHSVPSGGSPAPYVRPDPSCLCNAVLRATALGWYVFFRWQEYGAYIGVTLCVYMYNIYNYMICRKIKDIPKTSIPKVRCLEKALFIAERSALQGGHALALGGAIMDSVPASQLPCTKTSIVIRSSQTALMFPASLGSIAQHTTLPHNSQENHCCITSFIC